MVARFRSWWQRIRQRRVAILVMIAIAVVAVVLIIVGYSFHWAGFNGYIQVSIVHTLSGPTAGTVTRTEAYQPGKTLWDWLQLLIIPVVLVIAGYFINLTISRGEQEATKQRAQSEREAAEKRAETEREIALDHQRETSLQEYIDKMSELFLHEDLLGSDPKKEVREIARIRTLTVLNRLDGQRKGSVLQFLKNAELINQGTPIINLFGANLSGAYLSEAFLHGTRLYHVDLSGANLRQAHLSFIPPNLQYDQEYIEGANLSYANLTGTDLSRADLEEVKLRRANLTKANLSGADLERADLWSANLVEADLSRANLIGADLRYANLTGADLTNATLNSYSHGANLKGANLKDVTGITVEQLEEQAESLQGATMPDGTKYD